MLYSLPRKHIHILVYSGAILHSFIPNSHFYIHKYGNVYLKTVIPNGRVWELSSVPWGCDEKCDCSSCAESIAFLETTASYIIFL